MKKHIIPAEHFMEQFHNHHHYVEHGPDERRPEWRELPEPRARGGRLDFRNGGRAGYADGGGIDRLLQSLRGSFSQLNQQPAPAATDYSQMMGQATGQVPDAAYQQMLTQALGGKSWSDLFPTAAYKPPAAPAAAPAAPAAVEQPAQPAYGPNWSMTSGMDANVSAPGMKRGGAAGQKRKSTVQSDIVERALAATRRK